ncbi:hypothetical protein D3C75_1066080 [compost metagenome]
MFYFRSVGDGRFDQLDPMLVQLFLGSISHNYRIRFSFIDDQTQLFDLWELFGDEGHQAGGRLRVSV